MATTTLPWWVQCARADEEARRTAALKPVDQFQRGLLTVEELRDCLNRILAES